MSSLQHSTIALVTGGARGIGRSIVQALLDRGNWVYIFDYISPDDAQVQWAREHARLQYYNVDLRDPNEITAGFSAIFENQKAMSRNKPLLDILVNNAGITDDSLALRMSLDQWDRVLDINLRGAFLCAQHALKIMIRQPKSYIVNISSIIGLLGNAGQANYAASKAGLIALTKSLSIEYASRNVLVNAIAPGLIDTSMTAALSAQAQERACDRIALKRFGQPKDIASLVLFLTSGNADYITGQVISVDGGMH